MQSNIDILKIKFLRKIDFLLKKMNICIIRGEKFNAIKVFISDWLKASLTSYMGYSDWLTVQTFSQTF